MQIEARSVGKEDGTLYCRHWSLSLRQSHIFLSIYFYKFDIHILKAALMWPVLAMLCNLCIRKLAFDMGFGMSVSLEKSAKRISRLYVGLGGSTGQWRKIALYQHFCVAMRVRITLVLAWLHAFANVWGFRTSGLLQNADWYCDTNRLPITHITNYHLALHNIQEEQWSELRMRLSIHIEIISG
jgi:hypothetical protein